MTMTFPHILVNITRATTMLTHLWNVYGYTWLYNLTLCKWFNRQSWLIQVTGVWYQIVDFFWQTQKRKNMLYFRKCMTHPCKRTWMGSRRQYICSAVYVARLSFFTDPFECWFKPNPQPQPHPLTIHSSLENLQDYCVGTALASVRLSVSFKTLRPRQNGHHFADEIGKFIFMKKEFHVDYDFADIYSKG